MRRKWLRIALWVLLTPIILFIILMLLLYVPPVQNLIRKQATAIASDATGMDISVERIDLRFPLNLLVRGVLVVQPADSAVEVQHPDTLLNLGSLNVRVQAWPLLKGKVEVDDITLKQVAVNSSNLMEGMCIKGVLGHFFFESHGIDLTKEDAILNNIELSDTHVQVMLADTTETPKDTTDTALNWKVTLHTLKLKNVSVDLQMPLDSMGLKAHIEDKTETARDRLFNKRLKNCALRRQSGSGAYTRIPLCRRYQRICDLLEQEQGSALSGSHLLRGNQGRSLCGSCHAAQRFLQ